ncbi:MAG: tetratricopeptide repeat protein, partial [candidate division WOR-3 bacterium]
LEGATVLAFEPVSLGARSQSLIEAMLNLLRLYGVSIELNLDTAVETKFRLFETVTQRLKSLADSHRIPHSLVIIVDDFEMFDPTSLEFLRYLAFGLDKERLLLVVTGLNEKRFLDLIDALVEKRYCEHIPIPPLEQEEVKNLLSSLLGEVIEIDTLTSWLFHLTGGNPLWTIETVYALIENKILVRDGLRWRLVSEKLQKFQAPQAVTEVVRRRIERLTPDEMEVLNIGAVASGPFTVEFLRAVGNFDEQALFTIISRLKGLGFLRTFRSLVDEKDVSLDTYILSSKILETAITERLSIPQRRELHRRVALTLELLYPEKIPEMIFDLAHHWAQTEIKDRAYRYSLQAGAKAQEWLLFEQALSFYEQGLALSNELISPQEKLQLMETVGKLREATGRFAEAIDLYRQGMGILVAHPELSFNKKILARFLQLIGLVHQKQGQTTEALNFLKQALLLEPDRTGLDYARLLADLGWSYCAIGNFNQAEEVLSQALNLAENLKSIKPLEANRLIAQTLYSFSVLAYSRSDLISARRLAERSLEVYELAQDEIMSARVRQFTATLYLRISEPQKAKECYLQALTIQQRSGDVYSQLRSLHGLGLINYEEGNWDDAYERFSEALRLAEKINDVASEVNLCGMLGTVCTEKGEWSLAQDYFQRTLETASRAGERVDPSALVRSLINFAQLKARKGDLQEAEENIKSAVDLADETPDPNLRYYLLLLQAEVALRRERFEQTRAFLVQAFNLVHSQIGFGKEKDWRLLTTLYLLASQFRLTTKDFYRAEFAANYALRFLNKYPTYRDYPVALRLTGLAKCYLGRAKEGKEAINRSIQILRHLGAKYELGLSLLASAEAVLRVIPKEQEKGNGEINPEALQEIEENLKEALSIFQTLGAKFEIARTEELLNDLKRTYGVAQLKAKERTKYLKVFYQLSELIHLGIEK